MNKQQQLLLFKHSILGCFFVLPFIPILNHSSHCEKKSSFCAFSVNNMFIFVYVKQTKTGKHENGNYSNIKRNYHSNSCRKW